MSYRDTWVTCTECGQRVIFTVEEQRRLEREGKPIEPSALCKDCQHKATPRPAPDHPAPDRPAPEERALPDEGPFEGTVKWYDTSRAYGFITQENGQEIFFHRSGIAPGGPDSFADGARVTYLIEESPKGPQAVEVALMENEG